MQHIRRQVPELVRMLKGSTASACLARGTGRRPPYLSSPHGHHAVPNTDLARHQFHWYLQAGTPWLVPPGWYLQASTSQAGTS